MNIAVSSAWMLYDLTVFYDEDNSQGVSVCVCLYLYVRLP